MDKQYCQNCLPTNESTGKTAPWDASPLLEINRFALVGIQE